MMYEYMNLKAISTFIIYVTVFGQETPATTLLI